MSTKNFIKHWLTSITIPGKKLTSGKLVPLIKTAIDLDAQDVIFYLIEKYPNTFVSSKRYIGKNRNLKL